MSDNQSENSDHWGIPAPTVKQAEQQLLAAQQALEAAQQQVQLAKHAEQRSKVPVVWRNILFTQHTPWARDVSDAIDMASRLGYVYFAWNGWVYQTANPMTRIALDTEVLK